MMFALVFVCTRIAQIITLIPVMGMLSWFINIFVTANALTPDPLLILFITSVLALAWAVFTLFSYHRSSANARFVALVDLAIFATLIAAVVLLRGIQYADCVAVPAPGREWSGLVGVPGGLFAGVPSEKGCGMVKACWAFAIMNVVFFFVTALAAFSHGDHLSALGYEERPREHRRHHHHHHHHHEGARSRSGSRYSGHRSPHSYTRRVYV
ncbi:hypothetical protein CDD80_5211 [Ophiocordyceps camponoti-rufipedis]|uniref:MARVEL domain-containing protein n=1 Tax=Ophiocordyceps camponoti-rufipedis TaxID=2004952 RepID=A0A2C5YPT6_9HYPO|nr:hypothetical protein CDD80_5211 [Ophiocordyceps camponoti-rufipedis]